MSRRCVPARTHYFFFTTRTVAGVPSTLGGVPVISIYSGGAALVQFTTGVTLVVDYDGVTGLNRVAMDLTDATAFPVSDDFAAVITTGTVNSVSVVGEVVFEFNTRMHDEGIVQAGVLAGGGSTTSFTLPTGRLTGVTVGMVLAVSGIGARTILTYNAGTGVGTTAAFASDPSSAFARVFVSVPSSSTDQTGDNFARLGAPAGASIEADIAAIYSRIGAPAGASVSADIAAVVVGELASPAIQTAVTAALTAFPVAKPSTRQGQSPTGS